MPISQTEGDFKNPLYHFLEEPMLFLLALDKMFSYVNTKTNSNFAVKLAERSNRSYSVYLMNHLAQISVLDNMWQWNVWNLTDCANIWNRSEAAKVLLQ